MKHYIGTKEVKAAPMNRAEYNVFRGWDLPEDEDGTDEGYLVEYTDGGKPNVAGYTGYVSWSPKEQFEKAYHDISTPKQRVEVERADLLKRTETLTEMLLKGQPAFIDDYQWQLLNEQKKQMEEYLSTLTIRLKMWK